MTKYVEIPKLTLNKIQVTAKYVQMQQEHYVQLGKFCVHIYMGKTCDYILTIYMNILPESISYDMIIC